MQKKQRPAFLQISGDVQYDFLYRSYLDIPYEQRDFRQHTLQATLHVTVQDRYPLTTSFSTQQNNSPYLRNLANFNLQYDPSTYLNKAKGQLLEKLKVEGFAEPQLRLTEDALRQELQRLGAVDAQLSSPDLLQQLVLEKERRFYDYQAAQNSVPNTAVPPHLTKPVLPAMAHSSTETLLNDSMVLSVTSAASTAEKLKQQRDSLQQRVLRFQHKRDSLRNMVTKDWIAVQQKIYKAKSYQELNAIALESGAPQEQETGVQRFISNLRSIGIGRTLLTYSELTAWNVGLTGVNVEYNKHVYAAFAGGKIDYGFREFLGKRSNVPSQTFFLGRIGIGEKERNAVILSFFTGRKSNYGSLAPDTASALFNVTGYSLEAILQKNEQSGISAEVAKTTRPVTGVFSSNNELKSLSDFHDWSNVGISIKGKTTFQPTITKFSGFYRQTGSNFQSFSLFTYRTQQTAWQLRAEQTFANERLNFVGMLRKNDFTTPYTEKTFRTNTLFTTLQLSARIPKYPLLTVGYFPGTQIYMVDQDHLRENVYYILNGSLVYPYRSGDVQLSSSFHLNRFTNKGTDSGFVVYSGTSYIASQTAVYRKLQWQGTFAYTAQEEMRFSTMESNVDFSFAKDVRLGAGAKYNYVQGGEVFWGSRFLLGATIKALGRLQFQYEKTFVPTIQHSLFPIETGRVTWFKYF